ncbi:MAG: N-acetyltransferase family protein [Microcystaceae cyanobacterium]
MLDRCLSSNLTIRYALAEDLPTIVEIYNASIPKRIATADLDQITVESRQQWFMNHHCDRYPLWVMVKEEEIMGWLSLQRFHGRPAYQNTAEISIYIAPDYHRQGVGRQLLQHAINESPRLQLHTLLGLIFAHNQPSLRLFKRFDFEQWGYLPQVADLDDLRRDLVIMGRKV